MKTSLSTNEFSKISYLDCSDLAGRLVPLLPCYHENGTWEFWLPFGKKLRKLKGEVVEGCYFAKESEKKEDFYLEFLNFMYKRAFWPTISAHIQGIMDDLQNLSASLSKVDLFFEIEVKNKSELSRLVITELEYIFFVCRSLFDLLQEIIRNLWKDIKLSDEKAKKRELPKSFKSIVMKDDKKRSIQNIRDQFLIPEQLAKFYYNQGEFFVWLKKYRDFISHSAKSIDIVFWTEKGFAISTEMQPFSSLGIWNKTNTQRNHLGSVNSFIAHLILTTFRAFEEFAEVISKLILFPKDIAPNFNVYLRGYHVHKLLNLGRVLKEQPWK